MKWLRWYDGTCEDGKFRFVARNAHVTVATVIGVWAKILEDASHTNHRGKAIQGVDYYAAVLEVEPSVLDSIIDHMRWVGLLDVDEHHLIVKNWKTRQFETDTTDPTNAERQARWRERHGGNGKPNGSQTIHNGNVTDMKRPDTDSDSEKKKKGHRGKYAFENGVIRINQKTLDQWKESFSCLDVPAELVAMAPWAGTTQNWFFAVANALAKKNRLLHSAAKNPPTRTDNNGII